MRVPPTQKINKNKKEAEKMSGERWQIINMERAGGSLSLVGKDATLFIPVLAVTRSEESARAEVVQVHYVRRHPPSKL